MAVLDAAAAQLSWPLYVAGDTTGHSDANSSLQHARALGQLDSGELQQWLQRAPIFASATLYEPFGLAILEAALRGCALVLSDIDTLRELWHDAAVFVAPRDVTAWRDALHELLEDPARIQQLSMAAQNRAKDFSPARMASKYADLYRQLRSQFENSSIPISTKHTPAYAQEHA
jgi:glycosyltransferase involved in cell wall biosynthesis